MVPLDRVTGNLPDVLPRPQAGVTERKIDGYSKMTKLATFGVGCFHLAAKLPPEQYPAAIETLLGNLDTVVGFKVFPSGLPSPDDEQLAAHDLSMSDGAGGLGEIVDAVEFSLRIPQRVQEDIIQKIRGYDYPWTGLGTEQFMVWIHYFFYGPVTIIECLDVKDRACEDPSDAVVIVREYLRQKLRESSTDIRLEAVGPSPFHVDFFVFGAPGSERPYVEYTEQQGYSIANVYVPTRMLKECIPQLLDWMGQRLAFYYSLHRVRSRQIRQWTKIDKVIHCIGDPTSTGTYSKIRAFVRRRRAIARLVADVLMFRAEWLSNRQSMLSARKEIGIEDDNLEFLDKKLDDAIEEAFGTYPTSEVLQLAKFYEERDSRWQDRIYFVLAALIGGTIGAILTEWLRGG